MLKRFIGLYFILITALQQTLWAKEGGWLIVEQKSDRFGNFGMQSTIISGQKIRIEHQTSTFIFDLESNKTTVILPQQRVFWCGNHDSLGQALFRQMEIQIEVMIAQLPENEREKASEEIRAYTSLMRSHSPDSILPDHFRIIAADSLKQILNYQCSKYLFLVDSIVIEEIWVTENIKPWEHIDLRRLNHMMRIFSKPNLYTAYRVSNEWLTMLSKGLLMRSVAINSLGNSIMEVSSVRQMNVREDVFMPPLDYRRAGMDEMLNILMGGADAIKTESDVSGPPKPPVKPRSRTPGGVP
jgi:hypothetical protein